MASEKPKDDPMDVVRARGIGLAGALRVRGMALGHVPRCVSFRKKDTCAVRDELPVFSLDDDPRVVDMICKFSEHGCGAPLTFVFEDPFVTVGCLRCLFGVDVVDLFPRRLCA